MHLHWNRRLVPSLTLGMVLSLGTALPTLADSATGGACQYTTSGTFIGTYCTSSQGTASSPTANPMQSPAPNSAGWNNTDVTVTWNWTDYLGTSGIDPNQCTARSTSSGEGIITLTATCRDLAGQTGTASRTVKVDKTAPTISAAATSQPSMSGWYNAPVTVHFTCTDALSGIPAGACPADQVLSVDGSAVSSTARTVTDLAGNTSAPSSVVSVKIDRTAPSITAQLNPAQPASTGWYNQTTGAPVVSFSCSDALSGIPSGACPSPYTFGEGANQSYTASVKDNAGNTASAGVSAINVDLTAPTVTYSGNSGSYTVDQQVNITCAATDALSGVASTTCQNISGPAYSLGLGTHTYSAIATDRAGNTGNGSTSFTVAVTSSSLQALANGFSTDPSVAASLDQHLMSIVQAPNANAKAGALRGFTHLVQAQTGKSLTSAQASTLIELAEAL